VSEIKAIETSYAGCRFRSRLEARWAVFFDTLDIKWQYEPEGFELPSGRYLPDFRLQKQRLWFEVKGPEPTQDEHLRAAELARMTGWATLIAAGDIGGKVDNEWGGWLPSYKTWLHMGSAINAVENLWHGASGLELIGCANSIQRDLTNLVGFVLREGFTLTVSGSLGNLLEQTILADKEYYRRTHGKEHPTWKFGWRLLETYIFGVDHAQQLILCGTASVGVQPQSLIIQAMQAATSARFEHGQTPIGRGGR